MRPRASARERTGLRDGGWPGWAVRVEGKGPAGLVQVGLGQQARWLAEVQLGLGGFRVQAGLDQGLDRVRG